MSSSGGICTIDTGNPTFDFNSEPRCANPSLGRAGQGSPEWNEPGATGYFCWGRAGERRRSSEFAARSSSAGKRRMRDRTRGARGRSRTRAWGLYLRSGRKRMKWGQGARAGQWEAAAWQAVLMCGRGVREQSIGKKGTGRAIDDDGQRGRAGRGWPAAGAPVHLCPKVWRGGRGGGAWLGWAGLGWAGLAWLSRARETRSGRRSDERRGGGGGGGARRGARADGVEQEEGTKGGGGGGGALLGGGGEGGRVGREVRPGGGIAASEGARRGSVRDLEFGGRILRIVLWRAGEGGREGRGALVGAGGVGWWQRRRWRGNGQTDKKLERADGRGREGGRQSERAREKEGGRGGEGEAPAAQRGRGGRKGERGGGGGRGAVEVVVILVKKGRASSGRTAQLLRRKRVTFVTGRKRRCLLLDEVLCFVRSLEIEVEEAGRFW
ncbi:hypothetical protein MARPO_0159s0008 [Marchantia polymorpha]|uniref:Uncharacterized protein n=1 Tax=Marchantia polymorpha TaxID=3197 RepID=A0A2R6W421_MARPO|nr:hypothetical protein MARPO_0159s0008 [Marchantia polymorpha]|eukprot:PTQ28591.1 hypothetical protein MARPO_0159s0008 [Marchantia polymorpha]